MNFDKTQVKLFSKFTSLYVVMYWNKALEIALGYFIEINLGSIEFNERVICVAITIQKFETKILRTSSSWQSV